ncbi:MAG: hypothetical protein IT495_05825 [Gammaproteobacteria bacterium]|nr:hypothetical protein [Gammaproteobacteria bacterium]
MWIAVAAVSLVLPLLLGARLAGVPPAVLLAFPPRTEVVAQAPFSAPVFAALAAVIVAVLLVPIGVALRRRPDVPAPGAAARFPAWGWAGIVLMALGWALAWTRFEWAAPLQRHTFLPPWIGYIVTVNALLYRRAGWSYVSHQRGYLLALVAASTVFWWYFEFANRIVHNWYYRGVDDFTRLEYVVFASLSFATVLPAVVSTHAWLGTWPRLQAPFTGLRPLRLAHPRRAGVLAWLLAVLGLAALAIWPQATFPLVWIAPLLVITGLRAAVGRATVLAPLAGGDYRPLVVPALAALVCGFFWELWNWRSLAHWEYAVPYVDRYHLFAMPVLGYAGYLPFGLECLAVAALVPGAGAAVPPGSAPLQAVAVDPARDCG